MNLKGSGSAALPDQMRLKLPFGQEFVIDGEDVIPVEGTCTDRSRRQL